MNLLKKVRSFGSLLDKKHSRRDVLTEEKLDEKGSRLEHMSQK